MTDVGCYHDVDFSTSGVRRIPKQFGMNCPASLESLQAPYRRWRKRWRETAFRHLVHNDFRLIEPVTTAPGSSSSTTNTPWSTDALDRAHCGPIRVRTRRLRSIDATRFCRSHVGFGSRMNG